MTETDDHHAAVPARPVTKLVPPMQCSGYHQDAEDRVDRLPPLVGPVDVLEVQPEREFVDGEADAHAEDGGGRVESRSVRRLGDQDDAGADDDQYAENLVMNVIAADLDVAQPGAGRRCLIGSAWSRFW